MNYEKAEKRLSDMKEKDILNDNDYEFLAEIAKSDDMCLKCDAADLLINHKTGQAVEILKTLSNDNDATVRASAYDNMWVYEKQGAMLYFLYTIFICRTTVIPPNLLILCITCIKRRKTEGVNFNISGTSIFPEKPTNSVRSSDILKIKITE